MHDINMSFFESLVENKIKNLISINDFENIKLVSKNIDIVENCILFSYTGTQADAEQPISVNIDFNNYKNVYDFYNIMITGLIWEDSLRIFNESCEDLKKPYCKLISQLEQ